MERFQSIAVVAFIASVLLTPLVIRIAGAYQLYDVPHGGRRVHIHPTPRLGGVAIFGATLAALVATLVLGRGDVLSVALPHGYVAGILVGGALMFATGLWDDLRTLSPGAKLVGQVVAAVAAYGLGLRLDVVSFGVLGEISFGWMALPVTVLWIVGATNSVNLIDGLDGLATGVATVGVGTALVAALLLGNLAPLLLSMALLGALLGFLYFNVTPARVFMGDSGSLFVGFALAALTISAARTEGGAVLGFVPLFALALPLIDTTLAIARRWLRGTPLSGGDARHIHHRLLALGMRHGRAAAVLSLMAALLAIFGLLCAFAPSALLGVLVPVGIALAAVVAVVAVRRLDYHELLAPWIVMLSGVLRLRRIIRDQIHAGDVGGAIDRAVSLEGVNAVLTANRYLFGFLAIEVCLESSRGQGRENLLKGSVEQAWRIDYPVTPRRNADDDPFVLRIWCGPGEAYRPYGAERVARSLAPHIERCLQGVHVKEEAETPATAFEPTPEFLPDREQLNELLGLAGGR